MLLFLHRSSAWKQGTLYYLSCKIFFGVIVVGNKKATVILLPYKDCFITLHFDMCSSCQVHTETNIVFFLSLTLCLLTVSVEFGRAVWLRFYPPAFPPCPNPSFVAHLGGVVVGLTLGVVVLQNYEQRLQEQSLFWIFFCVYTLFVLCAVFWNIFAYSLLEVRLPPPP